MKRLDLLATLTVAAAAGFVGFTIRQALVLDLSSVKHVLRSTAPGFPREVDLGNGRRFAIANQPQRIVASSARLIDFCAALVLPERIAGYPEQAIEYTTLGDKEAAFRDRPRFREYLAEPVMELEPDLVLADPWQSVDTRARLEEANTPVLVLREATTLADMEDCLTLLGKVLGEESAAKREIDDVDRRVASLHARATGRRIRAVAYSNFGSQGFSAGSGTTIDEAMQLAGIDNALALDGVKGHVNLTFEQLIALDPDAIVVSLPLNAPSGHTGDKGGASEHLLETEESVASLRAVNEHRYLRVPAGLYASGSHGIVHTAEVLADERDRLLAEDAARSVGRGER